MRIEKERVPEHFCTRTRSGSRRHYLPFIEHIIAYFLTYGNIFNIFRFAKKINYAYNTRFLFIKIPSLSKTNDKIQTYKKKLIKKYDNEEEIKYITEENDQLLEAINLIIKIEEKSIIVYLRTVCVPTVLNILIF